MKRLLILIVTFGFIILSYNYYLPKDSITTNVFKVDNGFGYSLISQNRILIKQEFIPVIQDQKPFCLEEDAQKTANLVKEKLLNNERPTVTLVELKRILIDFNCVNLH